MLFEEASNNVPHRDMIGEGAAGGDGAAWSLLGEVNEAGGMCRRSCVTKKDPTEDLGDNFWVSVAELCELAVFQQIVL